MTRRNKRRPGWSDSGTTAWPSRRGFRLAANMERYVSVDGAACPIVSAVRHHELTREAAPLPAPLASSMETLGRWHPLHGDLEASMPANDARELWLAAIETARRSRDRQIAAWLEEPDTLTAWQTVIVLATAIAHSIRYPRLPLRDRARDMPWFDERHARARWRDRAEAAELLFASISTVGLDLRPIVRGTRVALRSGARGVCRHYAAMLQALFLAAKRTTKRFDGCHVITISGSHSFTSLVHHAWNWFVEPQFDRIVALDLTGADWLLDRGDAKSILNRGFEASHWNNMSAFLGTIIRSADTSDACLDVGKELLPRLVRPSTVRGQALLFRLVQQGAIHPDVCERVVRGLKQLGMDRALPGWRLAVRLRASVFRNALFKAVDPCRQHALIDTILDD